MCQVVSANPHPPQIRALHRRAVAILNDPDKCLVRVQARERERSVQTQGML